MPKYKNSLKRVDGEKTSYKRSRRDEGTGLDYSTGRTKLDPSKPVTACKVEKDSDGNIVYPIVVTQTLKILNLGVVEYERANFHSHRNIFPIGFKSVRESTSMINPDKRCDYICEILDGGSGPLYKVTCEDDMDNPIIKDASSGAWIEICKRINEL